MHKTDSESTRLVHWLGYAGLIPFATLAAFAWLRPDEPLISGALRAYAAAIATFLGAVHWGMVLGGAGPGSATGRSIALVWGVMPSLLAWIVLILPLRSGLWAASVLLILCYTADRVLLAPNRTPHVPGWYLRLRTRLTVGALVCLGAALLAG